MNNNPESHEEAKTSSENLDSENRETRLQVSSSMIAPFPSEHVPPIIIKGGSLTMSVDEKLTLIGGTAGALQYQHSANPFLMRRLAVTASVSGIPEPIYQNTNEFNQIKIWLLPNLATPPQITIDNRAGRLIMTVDQVLLIASVSIPEPGLGERFTHTHPGFGGSPFAIERVLVLAQDGTVLFQNFQASEYKLILFKQHP